MTRNQAVKEARLWNELDSQWRGEKPIPWAKVKKRLGL